MSAVAGNDGAASVAVHLGRFLRNRRRKKKKKNEAATSINFFVRLSSSSSCSPFCAGVRFPPWLAWLVAGLPAVHAAHYHHYGDECRSTREERSAELFLIVFRQTFWQLFPGRREPSRSIDALHKYLQKAFTHTHTSTRARA